MNRKHLTRESLGGKANGSTLQKVIKL